MDASSGRMDATFRASSRAVSCMVSAAMSGKMVVGMRVRINLTRRTAKALTRTQMVADIRVSGKTACSMASAALLTLRVCMKGKASGLSANLSNGLNLSSHEYNRRAKSLPTISAPVRMSPQLNFLYFMSYCKLKNET